MLKSSLYIIGEIFNDDERWTRRKYLEWNKRLKNRNKKVEGGSKDEGKEEGKEKIRKEEKT